MAGPNDSTEERVQTLLRDSLAELDRRGITCSKWGEDFDLNAMFRSAEARCYLTNFIPPPPFAYSLEDELSLGRTVKLTKANIEELFDYSSKCTGLASLSTPPSYLTEDDFVDLTRIYLNKIYGEEIGLVLKQVAEKLNITDDNRLRISREPKAEMILAVYFLQKVIVDGNLHYFYLVENKQELRLTSRLSEINDYLTDVELTPSQVSADGLLLPFCSGEKVIRMVTKSKTWQELLEGKLPPPKFNGHYQIHEFRKSWL